MLTLWLIIVNWCVGSTLYEKTRYWKSQSPTGDDLKWKLVRDFWSGFSIVSLWCNWRCCCCPEVALLCLAPLNYDGLLGATWMCRCPGVALLCLAPLNYADPWCYLDVTRTVWYLLMQPESTRPGFHLWLFGLPTCLGVSPMAIKGCQPVWEFHRWLFRVANLFGSFTDGFFGGPPWVFTSLSPFTLEV